MRFPGFISGSYQSQSVVSDAERTVNFYPEQIESPSGENRFALYPTGGFSDFIQAGQIPDINCRALKVCGTRVFAVVGAGFYELFMNGTATKRGTVTQDANLATISFNGQAGGHVFTTSGTNGYCFVLATNAFSQVLTGDATMGGMTNGVFLAFNSATGHVRYSAINDGTSWSALDFFARSLRPDPWQAMVIGPDFRVWLIGSETSEIWAYYGTLTNPFQPNAGAVIPYGTCAPWSVVTADNKIKWLSQTGLGAGVFVIASGYYPERGSTHATAFAWSNARRSGTITDAESLAYQDQDHVFTSLNFQHADMTWCQDDSTSLWHERGKWIAGVYHVATPRAHCYAFEQHLVGHRDSGRISTMDILNTSEADGSVIRRLRQAPGLTDEHRYTRFSNLELLLESGLGLVAGQGSDPQVMLSYSDDAGHTWSNERTASAGRIGQFTKQVYWDRLGVSRHRVFRVSMTDPIPWRITDAFLNTAGRR